MFSATISATLHLQNALNQLAQPGTGFNPDYFDSCSGSTVGSSDCRSFFCSTTRLNSAGVTWVTGLIFACEGDDRMTPAMNLRIEDPDSNILLETEFLESVTVEVPGVNDTFLEVSITQMDSGIEFGVSLPSYQTAPPST